MKLLADVDTGLTPGALLAIHEPINTVYGWQDADPYTGPRCDRCNRLLHVHVWQLKDDQGVTVECEVTR